METLYLIVPFSLIFLVLAIKLLFWAINNGQYDDLNTEAQRILFEEDNVSPKSNHIPDKHLINTASITKDKETAYNTTHNKKNNLD